MAMMDLIPRRRSVPRRSSGRTTPYFPMRDVMEQFDRFFDEFSRPFLSGSAEWMPPSDILESDTEYVVNVELPGIDMKTLDISYSNGLLSLKGEKKDDVREGETCLYCGERYLGTFHRNVQIPGDIDEEKIDAHYSDGVLRVTLPKTHASKIKKIEIH